jgi:hypothetical protein
VDPNDALALAGALAEKIRKAKFRTTREEPEDLEEFYAYYDEDQQRVVVQAAEEAVALFLTGFASVSSSSDASRAFVREVKEPVRLLCRSLRAAKPTFDPSAVEAALSSVTFTPPRRTAEGSKPTPEARAAFNDLFADFANSQEERTLLDTVAAKACSVQTGSGPVVVTFSGGRTLSTSKPGTPGPSFPPSYAALATRFGSVLWQHGGASMGFLGVDRTGSPNGGSWEWAALEEGGNADLLASLRKQKRGFKDIHCAFACGQNWILFDPTRTAANGEPALAFVAHGDCVWRPMRSADGLHASGVLLRLMAWSLADLTGLLPDLSA